MFSKRWLIDTAERVIATFLETFLAVWAGTQVVDISVAGAKMAVFGALAAAAATLKAAIAGARTNTEGASLVLPATPAGAPQGDTERGFRG